MRRTARQPRTVISWLCAACVVLAIAPAAPAATAVSVSGTTLTAIGGGEVNAIAITAPGGGNLRVDDVSGGVTVSPPCISDTGGALCPVAGLTAISADGGDGADTVTVSPAIALPATLGAGATGADTITGGGGDDTINGNAEANTLTGGDGKDAINGGDGSDLMHGGPGDDTLDAGFNFTAADQLFGDDGNDTLQGWAGADTLDGGDGNDTLKGGHGADTLVGGAGDDALFGQGDADPLLDGGDGNDALDPGECGATHPGQVDVVNGGPGANSVNFEPLGCFPYPYGGVVVTLDGVANDSEGGGDPNFPMNVLNVTTIRGTGGGRDVITGSSAGETIIGNGDRSDVTGGLGDALDGAGGDDVISSSGANEVLQGGPGSDTISFAPAGACNVSLDGVANDGPGGLANPDNVLGFENAIGCGGGGTVTGDGGDNVLIGSGSNDVINGGAGDDALLGSGSSDQLNGGDGQDRLFGEGGDDVLHGDGGDDELVGGTEKDTLIGDAGRDLADYSAAYFAVTVTLDGAGNDGLAGEQDNVQTDDVLGGQAADAITGDGGDNRLLGGPGADALHGAGGDDHLVGGGGADVLDGQAGSDTADYSGSSGGLTVTLDGAANDGLPGEGDNALTENVLGGAGPDLLTGDGGPNDLSGAEGNDAIAGGSGDDVLTGGPGLDAISSGAGADTLRARDGEVDTLTCDALSGKVILADSIDVSSTCDLSASAAGPVPAVLTQHDPPLPATGTARSSGPRSAAQLAAALTGRVRAGSTVRLRGGARRLRLGELACRDGQRCSARINVGAGAATLATGKVTVTSDRTVLTATLSAEGRRILRVRRRASVIATITLTEGATRAVVRLRFSVAGGAR